MSGKGDDERQTNAPGDSSSLLPMLVSGLVLIVIGMIAVAAFT